MKKASYVNRKCIEVNVVNITHIHIHHVLIYPQGINYSFIGHNERFDGFS